jgi:alpha-amylase/alpha-mannosidase (GH57 family)
MKFVCIHGHFYQPPRENAWTGRIDAQPSAAPYHDWNERITAECYGPNGVPISVETGGAVRVLPPNYSRISFNFGPTLLSWLEDRAPAVYASILAADRHSRQRFSGHGSALAQAYNHVILPLANRRDKVTQVVWGVRDFEHRFHRSPEGMWLPETAVDLETLEVLALHGIRFTILSPHQALRWRPRGEPAWVEAEGGSIDPTRPYEVRLPSGSRVAVFFYDGSTSNAIAFGELAAGGESLARRLVALAGESEESRLANVATDGETYGHHFRGGEVVLAQALQAIEESGVARLTNYGEFLARRPPACEAQIRENTAWSCAHGLGRWSEDCGCRIAMGPGGGNQAWRSPLRRALDGLRDGLAAVFEERGRDIFFDPWSARNAYIAAVLDPDPRVFTEVVGWHARRPLERADEAFAKRLLEMQRFAMLMYTSCGWFFDDPSGLETTQILQYAARAVELAGDLAPAGLELEFLEHLSLAASNDAEAGDARRIYERAAGAGRGEAGTRDSGLGTRIPD